MHPIHLHIGLLTVYELKLNENKLMNFKLLRRGFWASSGKCFTSSFLLQNKTTSKVKFLFVFRFYQCLEGLGFASIYLLTAPIAAYKIV